MSISAIHHYIPRFLIRKFADDNGLLYIYNKESRQIIQKGPGGIFWELNRNTIEVADQLGDQMERLYQALDDRFAKALTATLSSGKLTEDHAMDIIMLATSLKWRIPANDGMFDEFAQELNYPSLPIKITLTGTTQEAEKNAIDHLMGTPLFLASKRVIFPFLCFYNDRKLDHAKIATVFENSYLISDSRGNGILSDSPIIERVPSNVHTFAEQILPLSSTHTFVYNQTDVNRTHPLLFGLQRDIVLFDQAKKYVVCGNLAYLQTIIDAHRAAPAYSIPQLREELFKNSL
jgi:hypothetical protein